MEKEIRIRHVLKLAETKRGQLSKLFGQRDLIQGEIDETLAKLNQFKAELCDLGWSEENYAGDRRFPNLWIVCFSISLEAGGLNRDRDKDQIRREFDAWLKKKEYAEASLKRYDKWCAQLTEEQVELISGSGEESEMEALLKEKECPALLRKLFDDYFDEVA